MEEGGEGEAPKDAVEEVRRTVALGLGELGGPECAGGDFVVEELDDGLGLKLTEVHCIPKIKL